MASRGAGQRAVHEAVESVVFGRRSVLEALAAPDVEVRHVLVARAAGASFRSELRAHCAERAVPLETCPRAAVHALSREPRHDQGVAASVRLGRVMDVHAFADSRSGTAARTPCHVLAIDGVTNPQNVGMIVRSAVAFGADALLWPLRGSPWISGLVVKASAGAVFRCPIVCCEALVEGLFALAGAGFEIAGLVASGGEPLRTFEPGHRAVFVLGSERDGLSAEVSALLDRRLGIPLEKGVESLNVAMAAALLCYQLRERRT